MGWLAVSLGAVLVELRDVGYGDDALFHMATGHWILVHGTVPRTDPWSWTAGGQPWVAHEWLWGVLAWLGWRWWAWHGVQVLVLIAAAGAFEVVRRVALRRGAGPYGAAALGAGAIVLGLEGWTSRPQTAGYVFVALAIGGALLDGWVEKIWPWLIVGAAWANLHGGTAVLGPGILGVAALGDVLDGEREAAKRRALAAAATAAGTLANPWGPRLWLFSWHLGADPSWAVLRQGIFEYLPPSMADPSQAASLVGALALLLGRARGMSRKELLLAGAFLLGAVDARRNLPLLGLTAAELAAGRWAGWDDWERFLAPLGGILGAFAFVGGGWLFAGSAAFPAGSQEAAMLGAARVYMSLPGPCWNDYNLGGDILWLGGSPAIDGRTDLYVPDGVFARYKAWQAGLEDPPAGCVVVSRPWAGNVRAGIERLRLEGWREEDFQDALVLLKPAKR